MKPNSGQVFVKPSSAKVVVESSSEEIFVKPSSGGEEASNLFRGCAHVHHHIAISHHAIPCPVIQYHTMPYHAIPYHRACPNCHAIAIGQPPTCSIVNQAAICAAAYFANFKNFSSAPSTVIPTDHTFHIKCRWIHDCRVRVSPCTNNCPPKIKLNIGPAPNKYIGCQN